MRAFDLALKDLLQLMRDRMTGVFLVIMPVVFTLMFGFAFGDSGDGEEDSRLPVGVAVQEGGGMVSAELLALLDASEVIQPVAEADADLEALEERVHEQELAAAVIVPAGYGQAVPAGEEIPLTVIVDQRSNASLAAQREIEAVVFRLAGSVQIARLGLEAYTARTPSADAQSQQAFFTGALERAAAAWQNPAVTVSVRRSQAIAEEPDEEPVMEGGFSHTSPSMIVQFAMAGLVGAGTVLLHERKSGALRRLLTTAISRVEILLGHYLAILLMILGQMVILVAFGQILLGVDYLRAPLATLLVMVTTALWTASLGLLIGALAKTEDQATLFALIPMFVLAGMGGAWIPLEITGETFQAIGHLLPTAWAIDAFENIVIRGLGIESVLVSAAIMLAYAVGLFGLAVWRFRFE
jgi:ABC-2 type transport system permease protein